MKGHPAATWCPDADRLTNHHRRVSGEEWSSGDWHFIVPPTCQDYSCQLFARMLRAAR